MKKSLITSILMLFSTLGFAQITKGDIQLGGSVAFIKTEFPDYDRAALFLRPRAGLFVSDLTSVGLIIGYGWNDSNGSSSNSFQFGIYGRFHKMIIENFYIYLQPSVSVGTSSFNVGIAPGMSYFLSPKFALEMNVGTLSYDRTVQKNSGVENKSEQYRFNLNNVSVGFSYFIKK
ncbi:MAG: hypothetical protein ACJAS3_000792 [Roseivirga sp.]|jgi:hypothetical protein